MDPRTLAITLAIAAGWLSFNSLIIVSYFLLRKREALGLDVRRGSRWSFIGRSERAPTGLHDQEKPATSAPDVPQQATEENSSAATKPVSELPVIPAIPPMPTYVLYVTFNQPEPALNQKVQTLLNAWEASYDASLQVYLVPGVTPQNPVRVANAYPPGVMPTAEAFLEETNILNGVSLIVEKPKRKRGFDKVQLGKLVTLGEEFAALGGTILDAERQPASTRTFKNITG